MPTVGVAKKLFHVDGIMRDEKHHEKVRQLNGKGDSFALLSTDGSVLGKAVLSGPGCSNPVYVSVGHRMGLDTAVKLVVACSKYRIPEPVRQADICSREYIRTAFCNGETGVVGDKS
ncbi:endonuclease V-like isoform X3 [Corticium candelabrum]|uniref:endonuclease V-like isoform X3 n=1 Tax=Corticium candelabrum TaxID=121492 RepID=UPI002E381811|nr:endonuclease V-like isoform X3 [Corticium candelabrum]